MATYAIIYEVFPELFTQSKKQNIRNTKVNDSSVIQMNNNPISLEGGKQRKHKTRKHKRRHR